MAQIDVAAAAGVTANEPAKKKGAWPVLLMLAATIGSASAMRTVFSPVQEAAASSLHINDFQMSLLQGLALSLPIAALALAHRGNRAVLLFSWRCSDHRNCARFCTEFWHIFLAHAGRNGAFSLTVISMVRT
jgi:hypothetical protein